MSVKFKEEKIKTIDGKLKKLECRCEQLKELAKERSRREPSHEAPRSSYKPNYKTIQSIINEVQHQITDDTKQPAEKRSEHQQEQPPDVNDLRSRLKQRLIELEHLPELLKNTELKLHDTMQKLNEREMTSREQNKMITELKYQLEIEKNGNIVNKLSGDKHSHHHHESTANLTSNSEFISKLQSEQYNDLQRQLIFKDEQIRELGVSFFKVFYFRLNK